MLMKTTWPFLFVCLFALLQCQSDDVPQRGDFTPIPVRYPPAFRDTLQVDTFFGKAVHDPYRWLEDIDAPPVADWVRLQNELTFGYLQKIPFRGAIENRLRELWNFERYSSPRREGDFYYFFRNNGLQNQSVLYRVAELGDEPELVLDPNRWSADGSSALGAYAFSPEGNLLAYQVSEAGSDWRTIRVLDLVENRTLADSIQWVKFSGIAWAGEGFYYCRYPEPAAGERLSGRNEFHQVYYHRIGEAQSDDRLVFADRARPNRGFSAETTEDERYLLLGMWESTSGNALYFKDLTVENGEFMPIAESFEHDYTLVGNQGPNLYFLTNNGAPNGRLVKVNATKPDQGFWEEILPEEKDVLLEAHLFGEHLLTSYLQDAKSVLRVYALDGERIGTVDLPGIGRVTDLQGAPDQNRAFFAFESFTTPATIYELDISLLTTRAYKAPTINFNSSQYATQQVWYKGYDGVDIPMFLTYKKGLPMDGRRPTLLYGYGGFNISQLPRFQVQRAVVLENNGIFAVANIRGGGEYGEAWHRAGTRSQKQNVFNDFQAAAEYLIQQGYTEPAKLAIEGRSNGGLLVGACLTQRPDLYRVALPAVGVLDMMRYHRFTIGAAWATDYGRSDDPKDFDYLIAYSPLHNVMPTSYPATLITTADHDDRVFPAHSFKFAAELQHQQKGELPILIRVDTNAGHGAGKSTDLQIQENADLLSFLFYNLEEDVVYGE